MVVKLKDKLNRNREAWNQRKGLSIQDAKIAYMRLAEKYLADELEDYDSDNEKEMKEEDLFMTDEEFNALKADVIH